MERRGALARPLGVGIHEMAAPKETRTPAKLTSSRSTLKKTELRSHCRIIAFSTRVAGTDAAAALPSKPNPAAVGEPKIGR